MRFIGKIVGSIFCSVFFAAIGAIGGFAEGLTYPWEDDSE